MFRYNGICAGPRIHRHIPIVETLSDSAMPEDLLSLQYVRPLIRIIMDISRLNALYTMSASHITLCRGHIRRQLALIRRMREKGMKAEDAVKLLVLLRGTLAAARAHLATIEQFSRVAIEFESRNWVWGSMPSFALTSEAFVVVGSAAVKCTRREEGLLQIGCNWHDDVVITSPLPAAKRQCYNDAWPRGHDSETLHG